MSAGELQYPQQTRLARGGPLFRTEQLALDAQELGVPDLAVIGAEPRPAAFLSRQTRPASVYDGMAADSKWSVAGTHRGASRLSSIRLLGAAALVCGCVSTPEPAVPDECVTLARMPAPAATGESVPAATADSVQAATADNAPAATTDSPAATTDSAPQAATSQDLASTASSPVARPRVLSTREGHQLLAVDPRKPAYGVTLPAACYRIEYVSKISICVSVEGKVESLRVLVPTAPALAAQLPAMVARWVYKPFLVEGQPTPFCYALNYRVRPRKERSGWLF